MHPPRLRAARRALAVAALAAALSTGLSAPAWAAPAAVNLNSAACPADISSGEADGCVTELQTLLDAHGYGLTVDGDFGARTLAAVRTFQSEAGLAVDGIVGPHTKSVLYASSTTLADPVDLRGAGCPADITQGATGGCVVQLQDLLNERGAHLSVDGDFGPATLAAVQSFQSAQGLTADGIVGPATKNALYGSATVPASAANLLSGSCPADMREGEIDGCVTTLQSLLDGHGAGLSVDGDFGPATLAAVQSFQSAQGLTADGIVGPATKNALYSGVSAVGGAPAPIPLSSSSCPADIQQGEVDGCVTTLQSFLNTQGMHLAVDGDFGPHTLLAVEAFQQASSLTSDGVVGPATKSRIIDDMAVHCGPPNGCAGSTSAVQPYVVADAQAVVKTGTMPYVWGGGHAGLPGPSTGTCVGYTGSIHPCPADHTVGVDCSGFTRWMYAQAAGYDVLGAGNTNSQIRQGKLVALSSAVAGDLVFFGASTTNTDHVGIYAGTVNGVPMMYDAFETGTYVREEPVKDAVNSSVALIGYYHYDVSTTVTA